MLRIICRSDDLGPTYVGGTPETKYHTFDVDLPELEAWLRDVRSGVAGTIRTVLGAQLIERPEGAEEGR